MNRKQKLELTWIGKENRPRLEPRILLEDPEKSYHAPHRVSDHDIFDNRLIFGDNLLALKALEQEFAGKVKCIYIDPPFNTGSAFKYYDDGLEHSLWLSLMRDRLDILSRLLRDDGAIFVHIDYNEEAYLRVLLDEVFGRSNFRNTIVVSRVKKSIRERVEVKALNFAHDILVFYAKSDACLIKPPTKPVERKERWHAFDAPGVRSTMSYELFGHRPPPNRHWQYDEEKAKAFIASGDLRPNPKTGKPQYRIPAATEDICDTVWTDIVASAFNWDFPGGEKNEKLIQRILEMVTNPGDWVLDSFAGSGTTGAVAHKMGRRWIMVELGEHCHTHIIPRMKKVIDGTDQGGISKAVNWKGGGGFRYYRLASSLLEKDKWGNWVINKSFNPAMLAEAVCKLEGFTYAPSDTVYWQHGYSTERDFIYVTTQNLSHEQLQHLSDEVGPSRTLLVMCSAFRGKPDRYPNLTVKKIPKTVLARCEWGRDDYSLRVENLPKVPPEPGQQLLFDRNGKSIDVAGRRG